MKKEEIRATLVAEWLALPPMERATEAQAIAFAQAHERDYTFKATGGRARVILVWLRYHLPPTEANRRTRLKHRRGYPEA